MEYKTSDSTEAALFKTFFYHYLGSEMVLRADGKPVVTFIFDIPKAEIVKDIMTDFYNHKLEVSAFDYDQAIKFIKTEIFKCKDKGVLNHE